MKIIEQIGEARSLLVQGKILAYPTEAVYGMGCDAFNKQAVEKIIQLKHRNQNKGFIVLIAHWSQLPALISSVSESLLDKVKQSWPGPVTWVFPRSSQVPDWLCGEHDSIAIRMSAHPIASQLCAEGPLVSTSANRSDEPPALTQAEIIKQFPKGIDALMQGELGGQTQPSAIYDVLTGKRLR